MTALALMAFCAFAAGPAAAEFGLSAFDNVIVDKGGDTYTQAAGHPYAISTSFDLNTKTNALGHLVSDGALKNVQVNLPPGLVGDPGAAPKCRGLQDLLVDPPLCAPSTQVGVLSLQVDFQAGFILDLSFPIYNIQAPPGKAAAFASNPLGFLVLFTGSVRSNGDYGIDIDARNLSQGLTLLKSTATFWGVPADSSHDFERCANGQVGLIHTCLGAPGTADGPNLAGVPNQAFLTMPTRCSATGLPTSITAESYEGEIVKSSVLSHATPGYPDVPANWGPEVGLSGCGDVPFNPGFSARPTSSQADSPTGLDVELTVPNTRNPEGLASANLKTVTVTLPEGMTISPSSADGLGACSPAEIGLNTTASAACPPSSQVGTVEIDTPLLDDPLEGAVYVAKQNDNPFKSLLALYIVAEGPGVVLKLPGSIGLDPKTGRVTTTFDNNPQLPFTSLKVRFKTGPRAPLAMPTACGPQTISAEMTPWSGTAPVNLQSSFTVDCPGTSGFAPSFTAGLVDPVGGKFSPFALRVERPDRQEFIDGLNVELPKGLLAKIKGVPLCSSDQAAAGACPIESRVGTVTVGSGPGSQPFFLTGSVSLTEGYNKAPYGLAIAVRAVAGPLDLGTVVVRQALFVDPNDAHVSVISDPVPTILEGIPLRMRTIQVDINRPGFTVAPTSCAEKKILATAHSLQNSTAALSARFQVGDCQALPLSPKTTMRLVGSKQTKVGKHPGLNVTLTQRSGQANLNKVTAQLPLTLALDPENANTLCEYEDGLKAQCPKGSIIGKAKAVSPMINRPLTGPVYFVKGVRFGPNGRRIRTLPTLLVTLRGEIAVDLRATSTVKKEHLVTTFAQVPDAAISRFDLALKGGKGGILVVSNHSVCKGKQVTQLGIDGQNGKRVDQAVTMKAPCSKKGKRR